MAQRYKSLIMIDLSEAVMGWVVCVSCFVGVVAAVLGLIMFVLFMLVEGWAVVSADLTGLYKDPL